MKAFVLCGVLAASSALAGTPAKPPPSPSPSPAPTPALKTEEEKTLYAAGLFLGRNATSLGLTPAELEIVKRGFADAAGGAAPLVDLQTYGPKIQDLARARATARAEAEKARSRAFEEAAAKEEGAVKTASGLVFRTITAGDGASPAATETVKVHYEGKLIDGTVFDSSVERGTPVELKLDGVIPCWTEALQRMKAGEKARLVCPSAIAYGDGGRPPTIPGGATLVFEVQLLEVKKPQD